MSASGRAAPRPSGRITRGTTNPNRLRRIDRWVVHVAGPLLRRADAPIVVDLGFGASPVTTLELADRLRAVAPAVEVIGLDVDPARVAFGVAAARPGVRFAVGGFELGDLRPHVVRAANVLRQYDEAEVAGAWAEVVARLQPGGVLVDATCCELGRRSTWAVVTSEGPQRLVLSARPGAIDRPSDLAERLPKALIHRNVPGERVHDVVRALDRAWDRAAPHAAFGAGARWRAMAAGAKAAGVPVLDGPSRWRLGELALPWTAVAPR